MSRSLQQASARVHLITAGDTAAFAAQVITAPTTLLLDDKLWGPSGDRVRGMFVDLFGSDDSVDITGPVDVQIWDPSVFAAFAGGGDVNGRWLVADTLAIGANINVGRRGRRFALIDVAAGATAVRVSAAAIAGGTVDVYVSPFEFKGGA